MRVVSTAFVFSLAGLATSAFADTDNNTPVVLEPSTHWNVDFGEEKCRLARAFGEGDNRHLLFIEQGGPSSSFDLIAVGDAFDRFHSSNRISVQFGELEPVTDRTPMLGDTDGVGASIIYSGMVFEETPEGDGSDEDADRTFPLPRLDVETAKAINSITVHHGKRTVVFNTGNLGEAITVLNECSLNFVENWGLGRVEHETMTRLPKWVNKRAVVKRIHSAFPANALIKGEQGIFRMRVIVEADGSVSQCVVNNATLTDSLESPACREMLKARFEPALDQDGQAMRSFYLSNIIYRVRM